MFIVGAIAWLMTLFFAFVASASSYNNFVGFFCLTILMIFVTTMTGVVMIYKKFFSSMLFLAAFVIASIVLAELFEQKILFFVNQCCF
ncbi:MAG TPA: hypothetical protein PLF15_02595 [bacterium]|nr:hypothetical protein [bacterium]